MMNITPEVRAIRAGLKPRRRYGLALGLAGFALVNLAAVNAMRAARASAPAPAAVAALPCDQVAAQGRLELLGSGRPVREVRATRDGLVAIVRPVAWAAMASGDQDGFAETLDCAVAGPGHEVSAVHVRAAIGGDDLARYDAAALLRLRSGD